MTSSPVGDRPKITPITAAACSFTNSTKNTDASYSCAIPAKATHLKITAKCASIGINGDSRAKAYFTPPSEPFTITDPEVICAEHSASGETSQDSAYHLVPVPKNVSTITILTEKTGNVEERKIVVSIMPLIIE